MMRNTYRDMDIMMIDAEGLVNKQREEFEKALMGKRAQEPYEEVEDGIQETDDSEEGQGEDDSTEDNGPVYPQRGGQAKGQLV